MKILKKPHLVGIDLGSSSFKLVQFFQQEYRLVLQKVEIREVGEKKEEALKELLHGIDPTRSRFFVTLNSSQTAVRVLAVPEMPSKELRQALLSQGKDYFPFSANRPLFDLEILGPVDEKGIRKLRVALAVSPGSRVDEALEIFKKRGVIPSVFLPLPCALHRLAARQEGKENLTRCLLDIGENFTELVIVRGKTLLFSRKVPVAGKDFTTAMTGTLVSDRGRIALAFDEAEKIKCEVGIPVAEAESESELIHGKISTSQIASMLQSPLEQLVSEINRCFDYYREETEGEKVELLELYGRGAGLHGLAHSLSEELGIKVKVGDPLEGLRIEREQGTSWKNLAPFAGAIGAALGGTRGINLVPDEIKAQARRLVRRATVQSFLAAGVLLLAFFYIGMRIQLGNYEKRTEVAKLERSSLWLELEKVSAQSVAHQVLADEPYWEEIFREWGHAVPDTAILNQIGFKNNKVTLLGTLQGEGRERVLSDFVRNLDAGLFKDVRIVGTRDQPGQALSEFELSLEIG